MQGKKRAPTREKPRSQDDNETLKTNLLSGRRVPYRKTVISPRQRFKAVMGFQPLLIMTRGLSRTVLARGSTLPEGE